MHVCWGNLDVVFQLSMMKFSLSLTSRLKCKKLKYQTIIGNVVLFLLDANMASLLQVFFSYQSQTEVDLLGIIFRQSQKWWVYTNSQGQASLPRAKKLIIKRSYTAFYNSESYLWNPLATKDKKSFKELQVKCIAAANAELANHSFAHQMFVT